MRRIFNGAGGATTTGGGLPSNHHSNQFANHYHNNNNTPATKTGDYIGGSSLDDILSRDGESVPGIVLKCTDILLKKGLGQPGIFRLSPRAQLMDRLTRLVNSRNRVTTSGGGLSTPPRRPPHTPFDFTPASEEDLDSIAVAGLLKFFLRRLPNGVVPPEATKRLLDLKIESNSVETSESLASIYTELCRLSDSHRRLLRYICHLLVFVSRRSKDNHMNCNNLAIIFGPTLFRIHEESDSVEVEDISTMKKQHVVNFLVKKFISEFDYFFSNHSSDLSPYKVPLIYEDMVNSLALSHDSSSIQNNLHNQELMASNSSFQLDTDRSDSVVTPRSESQVLSPHIRKLIRKVIVENLYPEGTDYDNLNEFKPIPAPRSKLHSGLETEVEKPVALSNKHAPSSAPNSAPYSQVTAGYLDHRDHSPESSVDLHHHQQHQRQRQPPSPQHHQPPVLAPRHQKPGRHTRPNTMVLDAGPSGAGDNGGVDYTDALVDRDGNLVDNTSSQKLRMFKKPPGPKYQRSPTKFANRRTGAVHDKVKSRVPPLDLSSIDDSEPRPSTMDPSKTHNERPVLSPRALNPYQYDDIDTAPSPIAYQRKESSDLEFFKLTQELENTMNKAQVYRKKLKKYEEKYEQEHGFRANLQAKRNNPDIYHCMKELNSCMSQISTVNQTILRLETSSGHHEPKTEEELAAIKIYIIIEQDRHHHKRPSDVHCMTDSQVMEEKVCLQRALLDYEGTYGRPKNARAKLTLRPLYELYRAAKHIIYQIQTPSQHHTSSTGTLKSQPGQKRNQTTRRDDDESGPETVQAFVNVAPSSSFPSATTSSATSTVQAPSATSAAPDHSPSETNPALHELSLTELLAEQEKLQFKKKTMRIKLRDFEDCFTRKYSRKPTRDERGRVQKEYDVYKNIKNQIKLLQVLITKNINKN